MGRRVAFILASIHEGTSVRMWRRCLNSFDTTGQAVFIIPGGRLGYRGHDEYLRNRIYDFACAQNMDGLVAWTSSLTGDASVQDVCSFMERFAGIPTVTIGLKVGPGIPLVDFDAYQGFYDLVCHMIRVHSRKRIVYLRGPENHASSQERHRAYCDAVRDCGVQYDPDLVSNPYPWGEGRQALDEIMHTRGLVPSLDFDAMVCASDLMMLDAVRRLEELGVNIPSSVAVGGFNDNDSNKLLSVPPTTVRMPAAAMMDSAARTILSMLDGNASCEDIRLASDLVVRRSCGCHDSFGGPEAAARAIGDASSFISWAMTFCAGRIRREDLEYFTEYAIRLENPSAREKDNFLSRFAMICRNYFSTGGEVDDLVEVFHWFSILLPLSPEVRDFCQKNLHRVVLETSVHHAGRVEYERIGLTNTLNGFKMALLSTRTMDGLSGAMHEYLVQLGFRQAYLAMDRDGVTSRLVAGYNQISERLEPEDFPYPRLLPPRYDALLDSGAYVVEPVISDSECIGHLVLEVDRRHKAALIEDVMASIASAIKGITLLEEAGRARILAENAERTNKEFYANVSEELREPLSAIRRTLASSQDPKVRQDALPSLVKAEHLLDLVLTEKGEVEVEPTLVDMTAFLTGYASRRSLEGMSMPQQVPALYTDMAKLEHVLDILRDIALESGGQDHVDILVQNAPVGLMISFHVERWHPNLVRNNPALQLAERTVVLMSGSFHFKEHGVMVLLPWPTLSGAHVDPGYGTMMFLRGDVGTPPPSWLDGFSQVQVVDSATLASSFTLPDNLTQIAYDASSPGDGDAFVLNLLHGHQNTRDLPFLCTGLPSYEGDLWTSLCASVHSGVHGHGEAILTLGSLPEALSRLDAFGRRLSYDSFEAMMGDVRETPSLVILDRCDAHLVDTLRHDRLCASSPILIVCDHFGMEDVESIVDQPSLLICNTAICESDEFISRLIGVYAGGQVLPPLTGALVKRAIAFLNRHACSQISRWQIADSVNISEDYLTRIFKKDMGISPWDYLNRYRIQLAMTLLRTSGKTINEVASETGFQDQAYFCRVFKKIVGVAPGKVRR